ncbi:MAG: hypothetical protein HYU41_01295 [Candidatus Rokubacteria bacterium]|nr:hypothetical protein [Candidatus Rokubacteria bacterium]
MQVVAFSTPSRPEWRWRIVNYAGETIEESRETFPSISSAVTEGTRRLQQIDEPDQSVRAQSFYRNTSHLRNR